MTILFDPISVSKNQLHQVTNSSAKTFVIIGKIGQIELIRMAAFLLDQIELVAVLIQSRIWVFRFHECYLVSVRFGYFLLCWMMRMDSSVIGPWVSNCLFSASEKLLRTSSYGLSFSEGWGPPGYRNSHSCQRLLELFEVFGFHLQLFGEQFFERTEALQVAGEREASLNGRIVEIGIDGAEVEHELGEVFAV
jgi:hypothetical protein